MDTVDLDPAGPAVIDDDVDVNPMIHLVAPLAAVAVTMVVRKVVNSSYEATMGRSAPAPHDPRVPLWRAIAWTAVISTTVAVAEVIAYRAVNRMGTKRRR